VITREEQLERWKALGGKFPWSQEEAAWMRGEGAKPWSPPPLPSPRRVLAQVDVVKPAKKHIRKAKKAKPGRFMTQAPLLTDYGIRVLERLIREGGQDGEQAPAG
jgi:hypothetical protein